MPEQIAERIYASITDGDYAPGERVREEVIAEQFGVSRAPVREALRILEHDSVVSIVPNRGAHVTQLSIKEVNNIFEIRRELFCLAVRRLVTRDAALLAQFEAGVQELEALTEDEGGTVAYVEVTVRLAAAMHDACDNERLAGMLASLSRQTRRYTLIALATPARRKESARQWRAMVKALKAGDLDSAAAATAKLIDNARREAVKQIEAE